MRSIAYALPSALFARLHRTKDLCRLAGVARQHHRRGKIRAPAEEGGRPAPAQGAPIRPEVTERSEFTHKRTKRELRRPQERPQA